MVHSGQNTEDIVWLRSEFTFLTDQQVEEEIIEHTQACNIESWKIDKTY